MSSRNKSSTKSLFIKLTLISCLFITSNALNILKISEQDLSIKIDDKKTLTLTLDTTADKQIALKLSCDDPLDVSKFNTSDSKCKVVAGFNPLYYIKPSEKSIDFEIKGVEPGRQTVIVNTDNNQTDVADAFIRVSVGRSAVIDVVGVVIGWMYFAAWSVSFYPQMWINYKRKSVVGLNFDFVGLNITGFLFYSFFNCGLFFSRLIQDQFEELNPRSVIPVELNDVVFALHAVFATAIVIIQCFIYEKADQKVSLLAKGFLVIVWSVSVILAILVPTTHWFNWLTFLYYFSYVKLSITILKYIPQAWYNYKRKSTTGWSIGNILLDFTGGSLSILQMFLLAHNYDDWLTIFKNFTKFGLGMVSILFDVLFLVQHYVLYRHRTDSETTRLTNGLNVCDIDNKEGVIKQM
ncbi:unnamed protein product [Medioppia subpectinata]|uniref:Cystinosin homolog n=1 Tax=Medioppia subpectinata TaxID=1979941 RepID=A0A7R9KIC5_9ACAR|nr:unnamed protein product [Medioppia subpectinata]CAG2104042.1 unnamed protein product [Medioppia subpectinata]